VTQAISFTASDGSNEISLQNLQTPITMAIPKATPIPPITTSTSNGATTTTITSTLYTCYYYDEASRMYKTEGCSFIGENLTCIFCQCNHATQFAAGVNQDTISTFNSLFNIPSLSELLKLSAVAANKNSRSFKIQLQQNILAKTASAVLEYKIKKVNVGVIVIPVTICVLMVLLFWVLEFLQSLKQRYLANWAPAVSDSFIDSNQRCSLRSASAFWSICSLIRGSTDSLFNDKTTKIFSFYLEIVNLIGHSLLWSSLFIPAQRNAVGVFEAGILATITATTSYYLTFGLFSMQRLICVRNYYRDIHANGMASKWKLSCTIFIYQVACLLGIISWLVLFGVLSTILKNEDNSRWLACSLISGIMSYFILDSLMVVLYLITGWKRMFLTLALRTLNVDYINKYLILEESLEPTVTKSKQTQKSDKDDKRHKKDKKVIEIGR
jgi:hypothetical protein